MARLLDAPVLARANAARERARVEALLADHVADFPDVMRTTVFDAEGALPYSSDPGPNRSLNIADRDLFRRLKANPRLGTLYSPPARNWRSFVPQFRSSLARRRRKFPDVLLALSGMFRRDPGKKGRPAATEGEFKMTLQTTASSTSASPLPAIGAVDQRLLILVDIEKLMTSADMGLVESAVH